MTPMLYHRLVAIAFFFTIASQSILCQTVTPKLRIPYREGKLWGYCDTLAKVDLTPKYDSVGFYDIMNAQYAIFKQQGKFGLLDTKYREVVPATYGYLMASDASGKNNRAMLSVSADDISGGWNQSPPPLFAAGAAGAVGVIAFDRQLKPVKEIIPPLFDAIDFFFLSLHYISVGKKGKWGLYNDKGEQQCEPVYEALFQSVHFDEVNQMHKRGFVGQIGRDFYFIVPKGESIKLRESTTAPAAGFSFLGPLSAPEKDQILGQSEAGKATFGFQEVLFDKSASMISTPHILVRKKNKMAVWDSNKNTLVTEYYDDFFEVQYTYETLDMESASAGAPKREYYTLYYVRKGKKCGAVDEKGIVRVPFIYDGFGEISSFHVVNRQKNKWGVTLNSTIYQPIAPQYEALEHARNLGVNSQWMFCVFKVQQGGMPGFVGENGKEYFINP